MKHSTQWTFALAAGLVLLATLLIVFAAVAQQPPAAPPPPEAQPGADAGVPAIPGDRNAEARERMQQLRNLWNAGGNTASMQVVGEHVYVMYGPYLCQFSTNGLQLEAKVDLREILGLNQRIKAALKDRGKGQQAPAPEPAAPAQP